ncbi:MULTISPECIES: LicD family protein [Sphingobacterium]|uniref:LicD family protein n=1 Tax=Sphingobacterium TaxID=28453 RepID=UPI00257BF89D|nr:MULTISPECIES: LicD family protein [Sphingobacterium]
MIVYRIIPKETPNALNLFKEKTKLSDDNFKIIIVEALDNCNSLLDNVYMSKKYGFQLSKEEINIHNVHKHIWSEFFKSEEDFCLVMEDNVSLKQDFEFIEKAVNSFSENWDVFFPFDKSNSTPKDKEYILGYYWGSCVYFLSKEGAKKLLPDYIIKQPVDDELIERGLKEEINLFFEDKKWFDIDFDRSYVHTGRLREISLKVDKYNAWTIDQKQLAQNILSILSEIATKLNIELLLHGGTLLGYVQHGSIIPWDDDIDLGIDENDFNKFKNFIKEDKRLQIGSKIEERTGTEFFKIWSEEGEPIENYSYKFPFIDLWLYRRKENHVVFHNGLYFQNALEQKFRKVIFEGSAFFVPFNSTAFLDFFYKEWRQKFVIYSWSHRLERVNGSSFKTGIETDNHGKFLKYSIY